MSARRTGVAHGPVVLAAVLFPLAALLAGCGGGEGAPGGGSDADAAAAPPATPPPECADAWAAEPASAFVAELVRAIVPGDPVWVDYRLMDGSYVLYAGPSTAGTYCLGAWQGGRALAYGAVEEEPAMLTILYGYFLPWTGNGGPLDGLVDAAKQPPSVAGWLDSIGVRSAVIMPVEVEGLPFEVPALKKAQIALHEGFHVAVQMPRWIGTGGDWPAWDLQPDRPAVRGCYTDAPAAETAVTAEREALHRTVTALLDGDRTTACNAGRDFLAQRDARYQVLRNVTVELADGSDGSCEVAEELMELEEGVADYVSWGGLYDLGIASRTDLLDRYAAQQAEVFYMTGDMLLHAAALMTGEPIALTRRIAESTSRETGALTAVFADALGAYCE